MIYDMTYVSMLQGNVAFSSQGDRIAWTQIEQMISKDYIYVHVMINY